VKDWNRSVFKAGHCKQRGELFTCSRHQVGPLERAAKVFARELLMPAETVRWLWQRGFYAPEEIVRVLGVSFQAVGLRMAELELGRERVWWG